MATVRIVVDSTADIPSDIRESLGIEMVPLKVHFGNETFLDSVTMSSEAFFERMGASKELPTTSQPSPADFVDMYKNLLEDPDTEIISIHISSAMSGTYQSAVLAKSMLEDTDRITLIDSKSASLGYGLLAVAAAEAAKEGLDKAACLERFHAAQQGMRLYFLVDTLEYLKRNGRIGKASALLGSLLNIKPVLSIDREGVIYPVEKVRGSRKAMIRIAELLQADYADKEVDVTLVHANALAAAEGLLAEARQALAVRKAVVHPLGPVIGSHAGPGTIGIFVTPSQL